MRRFLCIDLTNLTDLDKLITGTRQIWGAGSVWVGGDGSFNPPGPDYSDTICRILIDGRNELIHISFKTEADMALFLLKFGDEYTFIKSGADG